MLYEFVTRHFGQLEFGQSVLYSITKEILTFPALKISALQNYLHRQRSTIIPALKNASVKVDFGEKISEILGDTIFGGGVGWGVDARKGSKGVAKQEYI